jgi:hypothetical protein
MKSACIDRPHCALKPGISVLMQAIAPEGSVTTPATGIFISRNPAVSHQLVDLERGRAAFLLRSREANVVTPSKSALAGAERLLRDLAVSGASYSSCAASCGYACPCGSRRLLHLYRQ